MSNHKAALLLASALFVAVSTAMLSASAAQRAAPVAGRTAVALKLPAVSQTCPMHPDIVESAPGNCPICKMKLVPVRLESVWSCPIHPVIAASTPGSCPICRRPLVQMTVALTWTCAGHPEIDQIERGVCADGSTMIARRTLRPHGNHNPQHGGQFFMAPDNTHHLEGAYPRPRVFRLYVYDDFARPLPVAQTKASRARVVTKETFDPATRQTTEVAAFPLIAAPGGGYLEARIDPAQLPAQMTAKIRFKPGDPEYRFDFAFHALSRDPAPAPAAARARATRSGTSPLPRKSPTAAAAAAPPPAPVTAAAVRDAVGDVVTEADPSLVSQPIPDNIADILAHLHTRTTQIRELIDRGNFAAVYVPAFQARDLAIALESRLDEIPSERRQRGEPAIQALVRDAWLLDAVGDVGNREQIVEAYRAFAVSVSEIASAFAGAR
jgi:hypothetical protein